MREAACPATALSRTIARPSTNPPQPPTACSIRAISKVALPAAQPATSVATTLSIARVPVAVTATRVQNGACPLRARAGVLNQPRYRTRSSLIRRQFSMPRSRSTPHASSWLCGKLRTPKVESLEEQIGNILVERVSNLCHFRSVRRSARRFSRPGAQHLATVMDLATIPRRVLK